MLKILIGLLSMAASLHSIAGQVIEDDGVTMDQAELVTIVKSWSPMMRKEALENEGVLLELLGQLMANKKLAQKIDNLNPKTNPDQYWKIKLALRNHKVQMYLDSYRGSIEIPDMTALAKEKFVAYREKYGKVKEKRASSHILIKCFPGVCNRKEKRPIAEKVISELKDGADFEKMVGEYSGDTSSKSRRGSLERWVTKGESHFSRDYLKGLFDIEKVGDYSNVVESRFGFHIIRLDGVEKAKFKAFDEVKSSLIESLENQYRKLVMTQLNKDYMLTDEAVVNKDLIKDILQK